MAFDRTGLYCLTPAQPAGTRIFSYTTLDTLATVDTAGYFNSAAKELAIGDRIMTHVVTGTVRVPTGVSAGGITAVTANSGTVVDVNDHVALFSATDTD